MSIKRKRKGPLPIFPLRWQELCKDGTRDAEAVQCWLILNKEKNIFAGWKAIRDFKNKWELA